MAFPTHRVEEARQPVRRFVPTRSPQRLAIKPGIGGHALPEHSAAWSHARECAREIRPASSPRCGCCRRGGRRRNHGHGSSQSNWSHLRPRRREFAVGKIIQLWMTERSAPEHGLTGEAAQDDRRMTTIMVEELQILRRKVVVMLPGKLRMPGRVFHPSEHAHARTIRGSASAATRGRTSWC